MTEQQERDHSAREHYHGVIKSYENEIIELKHLNDQLVNKSEYYMEEVKKGRSVIDFYSKHLEISYNDRDKYINWAFVMGALTGIVITIAIISLL